MIYHGDLFTVLPKLPANSYDACVTDGPYGIGFMGREWDVFKPGAGRSSKLMHPRERAIVSANPNVNGRRRTPASSPSQIEYDRSLEGQRGFQKFTERWATELYRVLKPGAYVASCGAPRSAHRMACGLEDAGFVVRDCFAWLFGQGFPKSLDIQRAIDMSLCTLAGRHCMRDLPPKAKRKPGDHVCDATVLGQQWAGWGSGLKPAFEPIIIARKPLEGTLAENVLKYGAGALNVAACRIDFESPQAVREAVAMATRRRAGDQAGEVIDTVFQHGESSTRRFEETTDLGRWPSNVLLDRLAAAFLDAQSGTLASGAAPTRRNGSKFGGVYESPFSGHLLPNGRAGNTGGASRFFYVPKPSRAERDLGLEDLPPRSGGARTHRKDDGQGLNSPRAGAGRTGGGRNYHPTVKPIALMQYLVRLLVPPGGKCIDPFLGSGTTGAACVLEHVEFDGVDKEADYALELAPRRIRAAAPLSSGPAAEVAR